MLLHLKKDLFILIMFKKLKNILIVILFGVIIAQSVFRKSPKPEYITKTKIDTIVKTKTSYVPKPVYHDTGSFHIRVDSFQIPTDTAAIVADYIRKIAYSDTLMNDSSAFILVRDTVQYNRITNRTKQIRIYSHTKTIVIPPKAHFYGGIGIGGNRNSFGVTGNLALQTRRNRLYTASYDILNKSVYLSVYWRIR